MRSEWPVISIAAMVPFGSMMNRCGVVRAPIDRFDLQAVMGVADQLFERRALQHAVDQLAPIVIGCRRKIRCQPQAVGRPRGRDDAAQLGEIGLVGALAGLQQIAQRAIAIGRGAGPDGVGYVLPRSAISTNAAIASGRRAAAAAEGATPFCCSTVRMRARSLADSLVMPFLISSTLMGSTAPDGPILGVHVEHLGLKVSRLIRTAYGPFTLAGLELGAVEEIDGAWKPNQYANPENPQSHYLGTGPELWEQTDGRITHFIAGIGTGGTITGVAQVIKQRKPSFQAIAVEPTKPITWPWRTRMPGRMPGA